MRIVQVGDQRNAAGEEPRIIGGAGYFLAEFRREFAEHRRRMYADFLEDPALHHRHDAAAAGRAGMIAPAPRRTYEAAGRTVGERRRCRQCLFQSLERRHGAVAQGLEPDAGLVFSLFDLAIIH